MVAFADVNGSLQTKVAAINADIRKDFLALNLARLRDQAGRADQSIGDYVRVAALGDSLGAAQPGARDKDEIELIVRWLRDLTYKHNLKIAVDGLGDKPTLDQYLASHAILDELSRKVARGKQKEALDDQMQAMYTLTEEVNPEYKLTIDGYNGFPITADDAMLLNDFGSHLTYVGSDDTDRKSIPAMAFPTDKIRPVAPDEALIIKLRIIYRYSPPVAAEYRVLFVIGRESRAASLKNIAVTNGHGNGYVEATFAKLSAKTLAALEADAGRSGRANIKARIEASTDGGKTWKPETLYMYLPVQAKKAEAGAEEGEYY
jgi:hypothetical protein